jgi:hypothetical protein
VRRWAPLAAALAAAAAVIVPYMALGGTSYTPTPTADPCSTHNDSSADGVQETIEQIVLSALDGAACDLGVGREELVLALRSEEALDALAAEHGLEKDETERAVRDGLTDAIDAAVEAGQLPGLVGSLARGALERVPPWLLIETVERLGALLS